MNLECGFGLWPAFTLLCLVSAFMFSLIAKTDGSVDFRRKFCDAGHEFAQSEDQSFVEMLDKLVEDSRTGFSGVEVTVRDSDGKFEGKAGCLWHNCQIYDGECYDCHSTRDAGACIETLVTEVKQILHESNSYTGGFCERTTKFASGEKSVAVDDASTTFQVCGLQYRYLGNLVLDKQATF